jgi:hypothetical protein
VGGGVEISAALKDGDELLADAKGSFVHVPLEHFLQTPEGRAAGEAWRERLTPHPTPPSLGSFGPRRKEAP